MHRSKILIVGLLFINFANCYATPIFSWLTGCCKTAKMYHENFEYCDQIVSSAIIQNFKRSIGEHDIRDFDRVLSIFDITDEFNAPIRHNGMILTKEALCNGDHTPDFHPLCCCIASGYDYIALRLLQEKADPNKPDINGKYPLDYAHYAYIRSRLSDYGAKKLDPVTEI